MGSRRRSDRNPQQFTISVTQGANDVTEVQTFALPVARVPGSKKVTVMEVLSVDFYSITGGINAAQQVLACYLAFGSSIQTGFSSPVDPTVFAGFFQESIISTNGGIIYRDPYRVDLQAADGNGLLIGTDTIAMQVLSANTGITNGFTAKILYRFLDVDPLEFVGIAQSQV